MVAQIAPPYQILKSMSGRSRKGMGWRRRGNGCQSATRARARKLKSSEPGCQAGERSSPHRHDHRSDGVVRWPHIPGAMPTIVVRRHHHLGLAKAKGLAQSIARRLMDDYGGSFSWKGDVLHFERTGASGAVTVTDKDFQVRVNLGFLLSPLRSRIKREIIAFCDERFADGDRAADAQPTRTARRRRRAKSV
jgi:putative polyhydroxyalkanoate system protein